MNPLTSTPKGQLAQDDEAIDWKRWPIINESAIPKIHRKAFNIRKQAIQSLLDHSITMKLASEMAGISRQYLRTLRDRCCTRRNNGKIIGWEGLLPGFRMGYRSQSTSDSPHAGSLQGVFDKYPLIKRVTMQHAAGMVINGLQIREKNAQFKYVFKTFRKACRDAGLTENDYPLRTKKEAKESLRRYVKDELKRDPEKYLKNIFNSDRYRDFVSSMYTLDSTKRSCIKPYQVFEIDGHKIDGEFVYVDYQPNGREFLQVLERVWLLVAIDVGSRAVMGWHLSTNYKSYTSYDVLQCLSNCLHPWKRPLIESDDLILYTAKAGLPSGVISQCAWQLPSRLSLDNDSTHHSKQTLSALKKTFRCATNFGPSGAPEYRPIIERYFRTFTEELSQRFENTTGGNPSDPKRDNPRKAALKLKFGLEEFERIIDVVIANYNAKTHGELGCTPLEYLSNYVESDLFLSRTIDVSKRNRLPLLEIEKGVTICGGPKDRKCPHINLWYAEYTSKNLSKALHLAKKRCIAIFHCDDMRTCKLYLDDGRLFDTLHVVDTKWRGTRHSLRTRIEISRLIRKRQLETEPEDDVVLRYESHLQKKARQLDRRAIHHLERLRRESQLVRREAPATLPIKNKLVPRLDGKAFFAKKVTIIPQREQ